MIFLNVTSLNGNSLHSTPKLYDLKRLISLLDSWVILYYLSNIHATCFMAFSLIVELLFLKITLLIESVLESDRGMPGCLS